MKHEIIPTYKSVEILINNKPIKQYAHQGKTFVEARKGFTYSIKVKNNALSRVLAVVSVDGINVIDGESASIDGPGYVINGFSSCDIQGFRTSNQHVNAFKFSEICDSYAAKNKDSGLDVSNCGVIGVRFFNESYDFDKCLHVSDNTFQPYVPNLNEQTYGFHHSHNPNLTTYGSHLDESITCSSLRSFDVGTEFSKQVIQSEVSATEFSRGEELPSLDIFYASRQSLLAMGVKLSNSLEVNFPNSFPGQKFCKPV